MSIWHAKGEAAISLLKSISDTFSLLIGFVKYYALVLFFLHPPISSSVAFFDANEVNQIMSKNDFIEKTTNGDATHLKITQTF